MSRLEEIKARAESATEGPWETYDERTNGTSIMRTKDKKWIARRVEQPRTFFAGATVKLTPSSSAPKEQKNESET